MIAEGWDIKPAARAAGIGKETGYRWLREAFVELRDEGVSVVEAQRRLGHRSLLFVQWEQTHVRGRRTRHQRAVDAVVELRFWTSFDAGASSDEACRAAGVSRSTGHRWLQRRFLTLREQGVSVRASATRLRLDSGQAQRCEEARREKRRQTRREMAAADARAVRVATQRAEVVAAGQPPPREQRANRYWELMRSGLNNTEACKILGVSRRVGTRIRSSGSYQTVTPTPRRWTGRYLSLPERLKIADLLGFGWSLRKIAAELGRSPSTIKRELDRHRDQKGRYLPRTADEAARQQRHRPRPHKLHSNPGLRRLVQRKLNRYWSPDQISGWLRLIYPGDPGMQLSAETIYQALLLPGPARLDERYCQRLRTGRRIRKSHWLSRVRTGATVQNKTMIDQRPAEVDRRERLGDWEGDLILGVGSVSAMVTLRERTTQYGLIINLPRDHTAATVNTAVQRAFASLPAVAKTLTWDQGVEMARHQELAKALGMPIYFAERCSPWQRGANENYNGLARQYFPKGTDLSVHSDADVAAVVHDLNTRPRKLLGYHTPAHAMTTAICLAETQLLNPPAPN